MPTDAAGTLSQGNPAGQLCWQLGDTGGEAARIAGLANSNAT
jgi:hypothetical protein